VLVTSREALNFQAEWRVDIGGLPYPDFGFRISDCEFPYLQPQSSHPKSEIRNWGAVQLFVERAGQVWPGFSLSQVGIYFGNRWARRPRPDERLNQALKGLDRSYTIYHYSSPVSHLLVGPAGVWVLLPRHQRGLITYERGRWRQKGGGLGLFYLKLFAQEGLGRPDLDVQGEIEALQRHLQKALPEAELPPIQAALVFTNELAKIEADDAPIPTLPVRKLKEFIRKQAKERRLSAEKVGALQSALSEG